MCCDFTVPFDDSLFLGIPVKNINDIRNEFLKRGIDDFDCIKLIKAIRMEEKTKLILKRNEVL